MLQQQDSYFPLYIQIEREEMNTQIDNRIKKAILTETEKRVAEYISKNFVNVCAMSALSLGEKIGTSDTSVIRTARKLGFTGYSDMQAFLASTMQEEIARSGGINFLPPAARFDEKRDLINAPDLYQQVMQKINHNINTIFEKNAEDAFTSAAEIILSSQRKFVMGFRGCASVAQLLGGCLNDVLKDVHTVIDADSRAIGAVLDIDRKDCLIVISYPRYAHMIYTAIEIAKKVNAKIIVLTDKLTAPITAHSDVVLLSEVDSATINNSYVAPNVIVEILMATVHKNLDDKGRSRLEELERYISEKGLF